MSCWALGRNRGYLPMCRTMSCLSDQFDSPSTSSPSTDPIRLPPPHVVTTGSVILRSRVRRRRAASQHVGPDWSASTVVPSSAAVRIVRTAEVHPMGDLSNESSATDLVTDWSHTLRLKTPVLNAPMGGVAGGKLASAITAAGGLGMIGVGSAGSVELLEREAAIPTGDGQRFGIGLLDLAMAGEPRLLEAALAASPVLISVSFGDDWAWAGRVRQAGILAATQISN